ncbi:YhfC family intramembrane metalloprotease [Gemmiger formicilis]|uniref:YhfC family intramembrane metalloprotease n=1 Tax=Gemmiger formicilis TaxID=745368 RepID=UPI00195A7F82|nr:YhfC family glutamic-type intramembrane protease [Gemmiger formicilis]MBM6716079.1 YhfC family intramembrane metalloprotease [Gemmiger formicilis]
MPTSVPFLSVASAMLSLLVIVGVPVGLGIAVTRKHKGSGYAIMIGAFCYIVGAYVLEQILHSLVFTLYPDIRQNIPVYCLYGGLAAGLFEETARYLGLRALCKKDKSPAIGFAYGVGHGGIEAILLAGLTMLNNLMVMYAINSGNTESLLTGLEGDQVTAAQQQLAQLAAVPATQWLAAGFERLCAIGLHLALSMLIWMVVTRRLPAWGYPLAIVLHAVSNLPAMLYQTGVLTVWPTEFATLVLVVLVALLVRQLYRRSAPAKI